ncbi:MAG: hypothetical protein H7Y19_17035 [Luteimonas sp.]|nr:hypothetical protein [Luteimonas sp.]
MDRDIAKDILTAEERALAALAEAEEAIRRITDETERKQLLGAVSDVIADLLTGIHVTVIQQFPELKPAQEHGQPDTDLTAEDEALVSGLGATELELIDRTLLSECAPSWRKVARVIGATMSSVENSLPDLPDGFYARRIAALVASGKLHCQGNLQYMRFSEVRLSRATPGAA